MGIQVAVSSAEALTGYPNENSNDQKIESTRGTMGRGKRRLLFPLPIEPRALSFSPLPSLPTTQGGL